MISRIFSAPKNSSFFIFGARGTGKSTLLTQIFDWKKDQSILYLDLLDPGLEKNLSLRPDELNAIIAARKNIKWVIIDEIQKIPKLLDVIHKIIFEKKLKFALTGSSARKLKRASANLLAGRAFSYYLYPLSYEELKDSFVLDEVLSYGSLPGLLEIESEKDKKRFLLSYVQTYIKEEVLVEQLVRNIDPFRSFLEVAAQSSTEIINYTTLAKEAAIDSKSVERYFSILADTLLGFFLEPYNRSIRSRQKQSPKFYFIDCGISRALSTDLNQRALAGSYEYGKLFEQFIIGEFIKLNSYKEKNWKFSYLRTGAGVEIDLIIEKNRNNFVLIEIKSSKNIHSEHYSSLKTLGQEFSNAKKYLLCLTNYNKTIEGIKIMNWKDGLEEIFS
jgi:predicted AAA+ superfamily ATPase